MSNGVTPPWLAWAERLSLAAEEAWTSKRARLLVATSLIAIFLGSIVLIEVENRLGLPEFLGFLFEHGEAHDSGQGGVHGLNHYYAIEWTLTVLLAFEVVDLVFGMTRSVANATGKQLEIFSLILLRKSFEELKALPEPIDIEALKEPVLHMGSDALGALLIFALVTVYYRLQRHAAITQEPSEKASFVGLKHLLAVGLLALFTLMLLAELGLLVADRARFRFFETFYTVLIFADVLLALVSMRYSRTFRVVFRNFGFTVVTIFLRLALTAPSYFNALLGLAAAGFAVGLTLAYNAAAPVLDSVEKEEEEARQRQQEARQSERERRLEERLRRLESGTAIPVPGAPAGLAPPYPVPEAGLPRPPDRSVPAFLSSREGLKPGAFGRGRSGKIPRLKPAEQQQPEG